MTNLIIIAILVLIIGGAAFYIRRAKKAGASCIGCPCSKECNSKKGGCSCGH